MLFRTARSILRDDQKAEEVVQDAYLLAYRGMHHYRGEARLSTWLIRIVANRAIRRRQQRTAAPARIPHRRAAGSVPRGLRAAWRRGTQQRRGGSADATLVGRTARDDTGGHAARLGRVLVLDPDRDAWIYDSDQRARDPVAPAEYEAAGAHADVHPRGDRIVVVGHALYLPQERSRCSHVHARGYVIATPGGACLRTLEIETNPFDAVGAVWCDDGDDLDVLVDRSGHWGIARYRADGCQPLHRFEQDGVLLGARLWRTPGRRYAAITGRVWPQRHLAPDAGPRRRRPDHATYNVMSGPDAVLASRFRVAADRNGPIGTEGPPWPPRAPSSCILRAWDSRNA